MRGARLCLALVALASLAVGCSKLSMLYVYNPTDGPVWIVSDCGQDDEQEFEAAPGVWTEGGGCYKPVSWSIWVKDEELALQFAAQTGNRFDNYLNDMFLRVEGNVVVETNPPMSYILKQPLAYLFLIFFCALPIVGLLIWRLFGKRSRPIPYSAAQ